MAGGAVVVRGYDRADRRIRSTEELDQSEAVEAWHLQISDDQVGLDSGSQGETIQPVSRLPGDLYAGEGFQDVDQEGHG